MSTTPKCQSKGGPAYCPDPKCPEKMYGLQLIKEGKSDEYLKLKENQKARAAKIKPVEGFFLSIFSYARDGKIRKNDTKLQEMREKADKELSSAESAVKRYTDMLNQTRYGFGKKSTLKESEIKELLDKAELRLKKAKAVDQQLELQEWRNKNYRV